MIYTRLAVLAAVLLALAGGAWKAYTSGVKSERAVWVAKVQADNETARLRERALQKTIEGVDRAYQVTKASNAAAAGIAAGKLRDLQAVVRADNNPATTSRVADPYPGIADQCAVALVVLDGYAKDVASKARALQRYTSDVCLAEQKESVRTDQ